MKKITTVLFDLDGTLIRMDQDEFIKVYFATIVSKLSSLGYDGELVYNALCEAVRATIRNDGTMINEERFWSTLEFNMPGLRGQAKSVIDDFYAHDFVKVIEASCDKYPRAKEIVDLVKSRGLRPVLATNPLFPIIATYKRMEFGGLCAEDFDYVTAYENSSYCKPDPNYLRELLYKLHLSADECVMIGNDTRDDCRTADPLGIPVFLLTECLINRDNVDLSAYPHGDFDKLVEYLENL